MSPELADAIEKARDHKMTPSEKFEQRVSFVFGQQDHDKPGKSKDEIRRMLADSGGWPLAEMEELTALRAQVSQLTADLEVARGALEDGMGQLHWINAQAVNIMDSTNHIYVTNEDSAVARMMIDSMASDIGGNAMMLNDKLSATLNTTRKDG